MGTFNLEKRSGINKNMSVMFICFFFKNTLRKSGFTVSARVGGMFVCVRFCNPLDVYYDIAEILPRSFKSRAHHKDKIYCIT